MADIAISYSHKDTKQAEELRRVALARGFTVWMDEAESDREGIESIAIPWGQSHWDVIAHEFIRATVVIVIDTPNWRDSAYCQREYAFLEEWGKWTPLLATDQSSSSIEQQHVAFDDIAAAFAERSAVASAHARIAQEVAAGHVHTIRYRLDAFLPTARSRDARLVLSADLAQHGLALPPKMAAATRESVEQSEAARRRLRRAGSIALTSLSLLVVASLVAWFVADSERTSAETAARQSASLGLAAQSLSEQDTVRAIDLATQALAAADTDSSRSALAVATANDARMRSISIDTADYRGAGLSADGSVLVAHTVDVISFLDAHTGALKARLDVPERIVGNTLFVSAHGDAAAFISVDGRSIQSLTSDGTRVDIFDGVAESLQSPDGSSLLWTDSSARLYTSPFPIQQNGFSRDDVAEFVLPSVTLAVAFDASTGVLDLVGRDGKVRSGRIEGLDFVQEEEHPVTDPSVIGNNRRLVADALVVRCGTHVHGWVGGRGIRGHTRFSVIGDVATTNSTDPIAMFPPVCQDDGNAWYTTWMGNGSVGTFEGGARMVLPTGALRYITASGGTPTDSAVVTTDGRLMRPGPSTNRVEAANGALASIPLDSEPLLVYAEGTVRRESDGGITGPIGFVSAVSVASLGDSAIVGSEEGIVHLDSSGTPRTILPVDITRLKSLRASSGHDHYVIGVVEAVMIVNREGRDNRFIELPWLADGDSVVDADLSPDGLTLAIATTRGRVVTIDLSDGSNTPSFWSRVLPTGTTTRLAYSPTTGELMVFPSDGILISLRGNFEPVDSLYVGEPAVALTVMSQYALLSTDQSQLLVVDTDTLEVVDTVRNTSIDPRTARLSSNIDAISGLSIPNPETGEGSQRAYVTVTLPDR